jgi:hypothetical protein
MNVTTFCVHLLQNKKRTKILVFHQISARCVRPRFIIEAEVSAAGRTSGEISVDFI